MHWKSPFIHLSTKNQLQAASRESQEIPVAPHTGTASRGLPWAPSIGREAFSQSHPSVWFGFVTQKDGTSFIYCTMGISFLMLNLGVCQRESALAFFGRALEWGCQRCVKGGTTSKTLKVQGQTLSHLSPPTLAALAGVPSLGQSYNLPACL